MHATLRKANGSAARDVDAGFPEDLSEGNAADTKGSRKARAFGFGPLGR
jgi:hypothetical protein